MQTHALRPCPGTIVPLGRPRPASAAAGSNQRLQAKLKVGPVDDPLEREADRVADRLVGGTTDGPAIDSPAAPGQVQRKCAACASAEDETVRRKASGPVREPATSAVAGLGGGMALPAAERGFFEPRLGRDLSAVRLHREAPAAVGLGARAFTFGRDIAFAPGKWRPGTLEGRRLLAHELVHVVQQGKSGEPSVQRQPREQSEGPLPAVLPFVFPSPGPGVAGGLCGPDVTAETRRLWSQIQSDFRGWSFQDKRRACRYLIQPLVPGGSGRGGSYGLNADAFDTIGLYQGSAGYLREPPYHPPCGVPGSAAAPPAPGTDCDADPAAPGCVFDPGHESAATCSNTVKAGPECWLSGSVNYGTYGIMMRLCFNSMPMPLDLAFSAAATKFFVQGYKAMKGDDPRPPWAWASATWTGGPGAVAFGSNRPGCAPTCPIPFSGPAFDYVWEPVKPR